MAEAIFVLDGTGRAGDQSELQYAGFSDRVIHLKNAGRLVPRDPIEATERDPTNRVIRDRLKDLSGSDSAKATDCGKVVLRERSEQVTNSPSECALSAFAKREPFYVRFYRHRRDSIRFQGFAGNRAGNLYEVDYDNLGWTEALLPKEAQLFDGGLTVMMPCPEPTKLTKTFDGRLACDRPAVAQKSQLTDNQKSAPVLSVGELLDHRRTYAHTLITARGCYERGFELSVLKECPVKGQLEQQEKRIWIESPTPYSSNIPLVFDFRKAEKVLASKKLRIGEVTLFGQFETTDWRDEPTRGGFGHLGTYRHELILIDILRSPPDRSE